jgi:hypothetical protein
VRAAPSRRRRLVAAGALNWWIGALFAIGSTCFALGAFPGIATRVEATAIGITFFVGSIFFTSAAALQHLGTVLMLGRADPAGRGALAHVVDARSADWWSTAVQLVGTVFFNITTGASLNDTLDTQQEIVRVWAPDAIGSICFLVASWIAVLVVGGKPWYRPGDDPDHRISALNMLGSIFFGISALTSIIDPSTGEVLDAEATNAFTFLGAVCFFLGALVLAGTALAPIGAPSEQPELAN